MRGKALNYFESFPLMHGTTLNDFKSLPLMRVKPQKRFEAMPRMRGKALNDFESFPFKDVIFLKDNILNSSQLAYLKKPPRRMLSRKLSRSLRIS